MIRRRKRPAYTLLEIILALLIAILLLTALYGAVGYQLRQAQAGRDATGQTTLSRSIIARIENDVVASLALSDSARFRNLQKNAQAAQAKQQSGTTTGQSTTTSQNTTTTPQNTTTTPSTTSTQKTTSGGTAATQTTPPKAESADVTDDGSSTAAQGDGTSGPVVLPSGVIGDSSSLTLFVSKVPGELYGIRPGEQGQLVSDVRRITYWMADNGQGLCRQEVRVATANDALVPGIPTGDVANYLLAPEIKSLEFRYFNGTDWADSWDSTLPGDDGITPVGSPRAIEVRVGVLPAGGKDGDELKYYRHAILIKTANGITQASTPGTP
jgi:hypothetical protein